VLCLVRTPLRCSRYLLSRTVNKERERIVQTAILFCFFLLQSGVFAYVKHAGGASSSMSAFTLDSAVVNVFCLHVVNSVFGIQKAMAIPRGGSVVLAAEFSLILLVLIGFGLWSSKWRSQQTLLFATFGFFAVFIATGSAAGVPESRYAFLPGICFLLILLNNAWTSHIRIVRLICKVMIFVSLFSGVGEYKDFWHRYSGPAWPQEVHKRASDYNYEMGIWPYGWHIKL
jgi:hypothetical protein